MAIKKKFFDASGNQIFALSDFPAVVLDAVKTAGKVLRSDGVNGFIAADLALTDLSDWPADADGYLHNDGAGNLTWESASVITGSLTPFDLVGFPAPSVGTGFLFWDESSGTFDFTYPSASDVGAYPNTNPNGYQTAAQVSSAISSALASYATQAWVTANFLQI